jgi:hypothetical protein
MGNHLSPQHPAERFRLSALMIFAAAGLARARARPVVGFPQKCPVNEAGLAVAAEAGVRLVSPLLEQFTRFLPVRIFLSGGTEQAKL